MRKKLLFIITKSEMGGAQRFLYELVTHLKPEKYDISVAAGHPLIGKGELFGKLSEKNIKTIKIRNFSNMPGVKNLLAFLEIFGLIIKTGPDVIYLLSSEAGFSGAIAGSFYGFFSRSPRCSFGEAGKKIKIIYRIGGWAFKEPRNIIIKKIYLWAEKISAPFKDIIVVNSEFDRQLAIKNKITKPEKIITIYNGININESKFLPKEEAKKFIESKIPACAEASAGRQNTKYQRPNTILIGTIANLYKNKGLDFLILAVARIKKSHPNWLFIIIGDGPERFNLEKLIKNNELTNNIFLVGSIANANRYLKAFELFVLPSIKEGQPWAILEAMAAEIPIVATNIAGIAEMIENGKFGILVEPGDPDALAAAIEKIIIHPSLAHTITQSAFTALKEKFSLDKMIQKNEELF